MADTIEPTQQLPVAETEEQAKNKPESPMLRETSWKPGQSGNPNGRPHKGYSITDVFKKMFTEKPEVKKALANQILKKALEGDPAAQRIIWNYMDGMPKQEIEQTGTIDLNVNDMLKKVYGESESELGPDSTT